MDIISKLFEDKKFGQIENLIGSGEYNEEFNNISNLKARDYAKKFDKIMKISCEYCGKLLYSYSENQMPGVMYGYHCKEMINGKIA